MRGTSSGFTSPRSFISFSSRTNPESLGVSSPAEDLLSTVFYPGFYLLDTTGYYLSTGTTYWILPEYWYYLSTGTT